MITLKAKHASGEYPIYIGSDLLHNHALLRRHILSQQVMVVTNSTVAPLYLPMVESACSSFSCGTVILRDGEQYKALSEMSRILDSLAEQQHHRDTTLLSLGGGVIGDMGGFAAACYHRGIRHIQIPTTLLAQVDASIGGKTAVNHPQGKNLIGAFHQPEAVIIDIDTLKTLPEREFRSGLAEMIKAGLICDHQYFSWLEKHQSQLFARQPDILIEAISQACQIKCDIVAEDEKEAGKRALLNLGHTFGHAIEQCLQYQHWLHGEAVAVGMMLAAELSVQIGWLEKSALQRIEQLLLSCQLPTQLPASIQNSQNLLNAMQSDKKVLNQSRRLILLKGMGKAVISDRITDDQLRDWLDVKLRSCGLEITRHTAA